jgi:hypothetical protein
MRRAVASLLVVSIALFGCFPKDPHKRTIAMFAEGGAFLGGIALEGFLQTGADCDAMRPIGAPPPADCHTHNSSLGGIGIGLILAGVIGFIATVSTAEEDPEPPKVDIKAQPTPTPPVTPTTKPAQIAAPPGATPPNAGSDAGSNAPAPAP